MKRILVFVPVLLCVLIACSSQKSASTATASAPPPPPPPPSDAPFGVAPPSSAELAVAQKRWPTASEQSLNDGYKVFTGTCARCHKPKDIASRSEEQWQNALNRMIPKAKLTAEEGEKVTQFVLAARELRTDK